MRILPRHFVLLASLLLLCAGVQADQAVLTNPVVSPPPVASPPHYANLSATQVAELLAPEKHLEKVGTTIFQFYFSSLFRRGTVPRIQVERDYAFLLLQKEAIRTAGEQHSLALVPNLIYYMDYEQGFISSGAVTAFGTPEGDRREHPAIDALVSMGQDAVAPLQTLASDPKTEVTQRVRALYVLHYLDAPASQATAQTMTAEFEKAGDAATLARIHAAVSDNVNERAKAHIVG